MFIVLKPYAELYVGHAVVVVGQATVVYKSVFGLYFQILAEQIVEACFVDGLCRVPIAGWAIEVVACLDSQLAFYYWCEAGKINAVGPVAKFLVQGTVLKVGRLVCSCCECTAGVVYVF